MCIFLKSRSVAFTTFSTPSLTSEIFLQNVEIPLMVKALFFIIAMYNFFIFVCFLYSECSIKKIDNPIDRLIIFFFWHVSDVHFEGRE